jgi:hypothetical protein
LIGWLIGVAIAIGLTEMRLCCKDRLNI